MALTHLLDTSVLSQPIKDHPSQTVLDRWSALGDDCVCTSSICVAEILQGLHTRESAKYWSRYRELLENQYAVLAFDSHVAAVFAELASRMQHFGSPRPTLDLMIAATACHHGLTLATLNARDFAGVPDLKVEDWTLPFIA